MLDEETTIEIRPSSGLKFRFTDTPEYSYITEYILIYLTGDIVFVGPKPIGEIVPKSTLYTNIDEISDRIENIRNAIEKSYDLKNH